MCPCFVVYNACVYVPFFAGKIEKYERLGMDTPKGMVIDTEGKERTDTVQVPLRFSMCSSIVVKVLKCRLRVRLSACTVFSKVPLRDTVKNNGYCLFLPFLASSALTL